MARIVDNYITHGISGRIGKECVFKRINGKTHVGKYPDRSHVKYSKRQTSYYKEFGKGSKFASDIVNDPVKLEAYKKTGKPATYQAILKDYIAEHWGKPRNARQVKLNISKHLKENLNERQVKAVKYMSKTSSITNAVYQRITKTSKPTATRDLQELVRLKIFSPPQTKGAGARYKLFK